jgi:hypothetical protein
MPTETFELANGAEITVSYNEADCSVLSHVVETHETPKYDLKQEAVAAVEDVYGERSVAGGFIIEDDEVSDSDIDVGVVIGQEKSSLGTVKNKFNLKVRGDWETLDEVGNGVQYCPLLTADETASYRNAPNDMDSLYQILYFGVESE